MLYDIVSGTTAVASDVEQLIQIFNGKHDIGLINLASPVSAPSSGSFSLASQSGNSLGIGAYNYQFTYITGQYKSDGITLVQTGETTPSAALSITTTSGNTSVQVTLPASGLPTSVIAINIYRTSVGGSDYKLIATIKTGSANYIDSTSDASRGSQIPPSVNTTGTYFNGNMGVGIIPLYGFHQLGGRMRVQALANPSAPTLSTVGTAGTTSYSYYIVARDRNGNTTAPSAVATITTGNATLSSANYVTISWSPVAGAVSYDILKGDTAHSLAIGVTATTINDTGQATASYTAPGRNSTADVIVEGKISVGESTGTVVSGYSFYQEADGDTGMFSNGDGDLHFYSNNSDIVEITTANGLVNKFVPVMNSLPLSNSWLATNVNGLGPAQYSKDGMGYVHLTGSVGGGVSTQGTVIGTLPAGYRPAYGLFHGFVGYNNSTGLQYSSIYINTNGTITCDQNCSLNNIPLNTIPPFIGN